MRVRNCICFFFLKKQKKYFTDLNLILRQCVRAQLDIRGIRVFVADEADQMIRLEGGLGDQTLQIREYVDAVWCDVACVGCEGMGRGNEFRTGVRRDWGSGGG